MSDLFENEDTIVETGEDFIDADHTVEGVGKVPHGLDARRRLENMLDEKRLRDELDDFGDY